MPDDDQTIGTTLPAPAPDHPIEAPRLATFDHPADRFELGQELGRGGMGRVVAATDVALARSVAIKQVLSKLPDDLIRFEREVRITAELEHPSIVPIHEAARDAEGRPYYVMRRIEGDPLSARLKGPLSTRLTLLPNLLAVVDAAAFAHARNIIHRDIKPSNILLGAYGETHLIDWGLARRLDELDLSGPRPDQDDQLTRVGQVYGTVGYMAPEQARGEHVDARADVYALGATLFHVLAGHGPFAHVSDLERLAAAVTGDDRVPLDKLGDDIPPELIAIVDKAMQHDRDKRYQHAGELAADLRAFLGGKLVAAHRYSTGERIRRFVRQHRIAVVVTLAAVIAVAMIAIFAVNRIIAERDTAEDQKAAATNRAELLAIQQASVLARRDPTRAAALLLDLDPTTQHLQLARDVIARAAAYGVSHGAAIHRGPINGLAFSPDGTQLASVGADGLVVVYQVATGVAKKIARHDNRLSRIAWTDDHTVLVVPDGLGGMLIDTSTGATRQLVTGDMTQSWQVGDRIRYFDNVEHALYEVPLAGGSPRQLAADVDAAAGSGEIAVFHTAAGLFVLDHEVQRPLVDAPSGPVYGLAVRPDGRRVAVSWRASVVEWDVDTGQVTGRWPHELAVSFVYDPTNLLVFGGTRDLVRLFPNSRIVRDPTPASSMWSARIASGVVIGMINGFIRIYDATGGHTVEQDLAAPRILAGTPDRMLVAMGSTDGTVRWTDLEAVVPRPIPVHPLASPCAARGTFLYAVEASGLLEVDTRSGATRQFATKTGVGTCTALGSRILIQATEGLAVIDPADGLVVEVPRATAHAFDRDRLAYAVNASIFELAPGARAPRAIHTASADVDGMTVLGDQIMFVQRDRRVFMLDRTGVAIPVSVADGATRVGLEPGGFWYAVTNELFRSDGTTAKRVAPPFEQQIELVSHRDGRYFVQLVDGSLFVIDAAGVTTQRIPPGARQLVVGPNGVAVETAALEFTVHYLDSGERITRDQAAMMTPPARLVLDERGALVRTRDHVTLYVDRVPPDLAAARAWLEQATNARIRSGTGSFYWQ